MRWAVVCLALLTYCTGRSSWTQPPSSSVSPGGTVSLNCTTTQSTYWINWYQQKEGEAPRFVHCDDRFTATGSGTRGTLAITNAQAEDEADYYCGSWNSGATALHSG
uniref:Ig-like domain-containing protein n=1 Tax=Pseudonaja textilis TaxID=8673 RepID=A0A670Z2P2_PSETE